MIDLDVSPEEVLNMVESFFEEVNAPWLKSLLWHTGTKLTIVQKGIEVLEKLGAGFAKKYTISLAES